jgi:hypothetical protein
MHSISSTAVMTDVRKRIADIGTAAVIVLASVGAAIAPLFLYQIADAAATTQVVQENNVARQAEDSPPTKPWVIYTRVTTPGTATFRSGPTNPPLGKGSLELGTVTGSDKVYAFNFDHAGTKLTDINAMGYSTYRSAGNDQQVTALNIQVDPDGPSGPLTFTTLVFEPVYNTTQGSVVSDQWQTWDAFKDGTAIWWSSSPIPGAPDRSTFVSWNTILQNNPNATIVGGYGLNQGSGNPALTVAVDKLVYGTTSNKVTYDFEPTLTPATKDDCKNGGWQNFNTPGFKNQGQCVSYVEKNSQRVEGDIKYNAGGLNRSAWFAMNTADNDGWFVYADANRDWYGVRVETVKVDGNTAWFAGRVDRSKNGKFNGNWLLAKVENGKPDKISGSFTTELLAKAGVSAKLNPSDGPFNVTKGNIQIKKD